MEKENVRSSNFELLRILAVLFIIAWHVQLHGSQPHLYDGAFAEPVIHKALMIFEVGMPLGNIGSGLFLMISGYFLAGKLDMDLGKIAKKILIQVGYVTLLLTVASALLITYFDHEPTAITVLGREVFNGAWWFIGDYMLVMAVAYTFLNKILSNCNQKQYAAIVFGILAIDSFQFSGEMLGSLASGVREFVIGVFFFVCGGYIKKFNPFSEFRAYAFVVVIVICNLVRIIGQYSISVMNIESYAVKGEDFQLPYLYTSQYEITVVIIAVCLFELFKRIKMPNVRTINFIAKASLVTYMGTENDLVRGFYEKLDWGNVLAQGKLAYIMMWSKWIMILFCLGFVEYLGYELLILIFSKVNCIFLKKQIKN